MAVSAPDTVSVGTGALGLVPVLLVERLVAWLRMKLATARRLSLSNASYSLPDFSAMTAYSRSI